MPMMPAQGSQSVVSRHFDDVQEERPQKHAQQWPVGKRFKPTGSSRFRICTTDLVYFKH